MTSSSAIVVKAPLWPVIWLKALRPRSFLTVLFPIYLILVPAAGFGEILDPVLTLLATLAVLLAYAGLLLRNDYQDHLSGFDKLHPDRGSRAIQNGWLKPETVGRAGLFCLILAIVLALPLVWVLPLLLWILLPAMLILGFLFLTPRSHKNFPAGELALAVLGGPLLMGGYEVAVTGYLSWEALLAGAVWGALFLFPVHLRHFEHLFVESQAKVPSLVSFFGFDRSQKLIQRWWVLTLLAFCLLQFWWQARLLTWGFLFLLALASFPFLKSWARLKSPLGSEVKNLRTQGQTLYLLLCLIWALDVLWTSL